MKTKSAKPVRRQSAKPFSPEQTPPASPAGSKPRFDWELLAIGCLISLGLLKFGNPIILDHLVSKPADLLEVIFNPWPVISGYLLVGLGIALNLRYIRPELNIPRALALLPLIWFGWQLLAALPSVDPKLSRPTLLHFATCTTLYYLGLLTIRSRLQGRAFWIPVLAAFVWVVWTGFEQHYGGLEATRKFFYEQPDWQKYPADYIKKINSDRIFSTLGYPNSLAGAILLFLPATLVTAWFSTHRLTPPSRAVICGSLGYTALACLFWSGSKSGWLIVLFQGIVVLLHQRFSSKVKAGIVLALLLVGLTGFFVQFAPYFKKGATSVAARFIYWNAALRTAQAHPLFGTGPGTFSRPFEKIKPEGAEMARLTHNDYLEQASDSGVLGFIVYTSFVAGSLALLYRRSKAQPVLFCIWLGLLGWACQSAVEFCLYIPALAWPAFLFLGAISGGEGPVGPPALGSLRPVRFTETKPIHKSIS